MIDSTSRNPDRTSKRKRDVSLVQRWKMMRLKHNDTRSLLFDNNYVSNIPCSQ